MHGHSQEEQHTGNAADELIDLHVLALIDQSGKLPDGHAGDQREQKHHRHGVEKAHHDGRHENYACYRSYNKIAHGFGGGLKVEGGGRLVLLRYF